MAQITVRDIDPGVLDKLRKRAKQNDLSLQAELREILIREASKVSNYPKLSMDEAIENIERLRRGLGDRKFSDSTKIVRKLRNR